MDVSIFFFRPSRTRQQQLDGLIEALKRFGYTYISYSLDEMEMMYPLDRKPYYAYIGIECLWIVHDMCRGCCHPSGHLRHSAEFLQAMIPVIGRLDAHAEYYPGSAGVGPRLRICL